MLKEIPQALQILWILNLVVGAFLVGLLGVRKNYRLFPAFSLYVLLNLALGSLAFGVYHRWGFFSQISWQIGWALQALVVCARALAVGELCRHLLGRYRGVWALAWRVLLACAALVLTYSSLAAAKGFGYVLPRTQRSLELAIATVIVALFVFVRYYGVDAEPVDRTLAIGFCLYSCFSVLNTTILDRVIAKYIALWNLLGMLAFLASLVLWSLALREELPDRQREAEMLPQDVYSTVAPEINVRLRVLNESLKQIWDPEVKQP